MKLLTLMTFAAGLAMAQPGTFTGEHYTGDVCQPDTPNQETNCGYVGSITGDIYASYAYITDSTGVGFPEYVSRWTPPQTINQSGPWTAVISWANGADVYGSITVTGTCVVTGGIVSPYLATYVVNCLGTDNNGNPASKTHKYNVYKQGGRGGAFWQQPADTTGTTMFVAQ